MEEKEPTKVGKRGTVVIPARFRKLYGMEEGSMLVAEARPDGLLLRPAEVVPIETYTKARVAGFLLNNAVTERDYRRARQEVEEMGLDPDEIDHRLPGEG